VLLFFGIVVLFYLSYGAIRDFFNKKELDLSDKVDSKKHFIPGIILTISNPAVLLLWTGIMGADLASSNKSLPEVITLCSGILIGVVLFFIFLIALINGGKKYITRKKFKYVSLVAGLILLYFGLHYGYKFIETLH
jgi:threonine/homoserine/homoserine lactone efflux protein